MDLRRLSPDVQGGKDEVYRHPIPAKSIGAIGMPQCLQEQIICIENRNEFGSDFIVRLSRMHRTAALLRLARSHSCTQRTYYAVITPQTEAKGPGP